MNKVVLIAGLALFAATATASAQQYPQPGRTITMMVPFPAGGGTDVFAKAAAAVMAKKLGVQIDVINKPGASSQLGTAQLAKAAPDGYTVGWVVLPSSAAYLDPDRQSHLYARRPDADRLRFRIASAIARRSRCRSAVRTRP